MLLGYLLIVLWAFLLFSFRSETTPFISIWYLMAALFWFPWSFALAHAAHLLPNVPGVVQSLVAAWASQNFVNVWLTAIGLAAAYYLIPKVISRPVHSYNLASIGFWSFVLFTGLTGAVRLSGGPIPAWVVTLSIAASILLLVQIVTVTTNLVLTMRGQYHMVYHSPTIRFTFFGAIAFTVGSVIALFASLRSVDSIVHFTQFQNGQTMLVIYSFFSMVIFGAIYYILPRLVGCEWLSSSMISLHFWGAAYGGGVLVAALLFSGLATGFSLADPDARYSQILQMSSPYMVGSILGWLMIGAGHLVFGLHFLLMLLRITQPGGEPNSVHAHRRGGETLMNRSTYLLAGIVGSSALRRLRSCSCHKCNSAACSRSLSRMKARSSTFTRSKIAASWKRAGRSTFPKGASIAIRNRFAIRKTARTSSAAGECAAPWRDYLFDTPPLLGSSRIGPGPRQRGFGQVAQRTRG